MISGTFPPWLNTLSVTLIILGAICAVRPEEMLVMNVVRPLTALFGTVLSVAAYYAWERNVADIGRKADEQPFAAIVMKGTSHCGAGCTPVQVHGFLAGLPGVKEVHDLHIWPLSTTETALTAQLVRPEAGTDDAFVQFTCHKLQDMPVIALQPL